MPRTIIDYDNTCFYKIVSNDLNITDCYVGHTTDFRRRKSQHKSACNNLNHKDYNSSVYQFIRSNGGWDNFNMILIEKMKVEDGLEARQRERYHVEALHAVLNCRMPSRTSKEHQETYRDKLKEQARLYRLNHQEKNIRST